MPKQLDIERFNTWTDFVEHCVNIKPHPSLGEHALQSRNGEAYFTKTDSWGDAVKLMRSYEWPEAQAQVRNLSNVLVNRISAQVIQTSITYDVQGQNLDVGAYCSGDPECWQEFNEELVDGPGTTVHKLVYNSSVSSGISTDMIIHRGVLIASLVNLLELNNHRVEVVICLGTSTKSSSNPQTDAWHDETYITVKEAQQPLDIDKLTVALAHPSVLRRLNFACMEGFKDREKIQEFRVGTNYGYPLTGNETGDLHIESHTYNDVAPKDVEGSEKWLIEQLSKQGIKFQGKEN